MIVAQALRRSLVFGSAGLLVVLALDHASGSGPTVERVSILERGIYSAESTGSIAALGTVGYVEKVRNAKLLENTTSIPGRKALRFGVRYFVSGVPNGTEVELRLVTRFPGEGLTVGVDERTRHLHSEYKMRMALGSTGYREFQFNDKREIVAGEWTFEFWFGSRKVGEQKFCVYDAEAEQPTGRHRCSAMVAALP